MRQGTIANKVTRQPKFVDLDKDLWKLFKSAAALKGMTMSQALEEAIGEWLAE